VSVVLAVKDGERFLRRAIASVLRQTVEDLELIVVDDGSSDRTPEILASIADPRLIVFRNEESRGLATSLNLALDQSRGRYVARHDADDIALPRRLEGELARLQSAPGLAIVGSAVLELDADGRAGAVHLMPGNSVLRWAALFSSPFFHPSVLVDRQVLEEHGLRYDPDFLESEDYDLWTRLLAVAEGDNLEQPLVLYRVHSGQASRRRRDLQREFQLRIARREITRLAPELASNQVELAWQVGAGEPVDPEHLELAADAYVELVLAFERAERTAIPTAAALPLARLAAAARGAAGARILARALRLDPALPLNLAANRLRRRSVGRAARREAEGWLAELGSEDEQAGPLRVAAVFPEPTPYRAPLLDRVAARDEVALTVIYAAPTVARRTWEIEPNHEASYLRGVRLPGAKRLLHHDYPVTPGVVRALDRVEPDVVVVSGWSTFSAQAAIAWSRARKIPYVLVVESHDEGPRPGWRRTVKGTVVPPIVRGAAGALVTGTLARRSLIARGATAERVRVFANTIDVRAFGERADRLATRRVELREEFGVGPDDVVVLSVARLVPEKAHDVLVRAVASAQEPCLVLVLAGEGPERDRLELLAAELGARLVLAGDRPWDRIVEAYVAADVFALLSRREPWAVVVNEAAACGLPLVLCDRVGAAHDLLRDGENGVLVAADDVEAAASALRRLATDAEERRRMGARSRELVRDWGYEPSVEGFVAAVQEAADHRRR
jgi:glycosyltransferase involved in cell wall biosynthesis/GT2 family glycosyltransferase